MNKLLTGALAVAIVAGGATALTFMPASAAGTQTTESVSNEEQATEVNDRGSEASDQTVLASAKLTQQEAEAQVKASLPKATVAGAELENENGHPVFNVKVQQNNVNQEVKVDAVSGKILKTELNDTAGHEGK